MHCLRSQERVLSYVKPPTKLGNAQEYSLKPSTCRSAGKYNACISRCTSHSIIHSIPFKHHIDQCHLIDTLVGLACRWQQRRGRRPSAPAGRCPSVSSLMEYTICMHKCLFPSLRDAWNVAQFLLMTMTLQHAVVGMDDGNILVVRCALPAEATPMPSWTILTAPPLYNYSPILTAANRAVMPRLNSPQHELCTSTVEYPVTYPRTYFTVA